jgi:hypothetical protein
MSIKSKLSFLAPTCIKHTVNGEEINFYAISTKMLFRLKSLTRPLSQALSTLFADSSKDNGRTLKDFKFVDGSDSDETNEGSETIINPIDPAILQIRMDTKERAVDRLVDAFSSEENKKLIALLICDSCRDLLPRDPDDDEVSELMATLDLGNLVAMLTGVAKANVKVFGPLGDRVSEAFEKRLETLEVKGSDDPVVSDPLIPSSEPTLSPTPLASPPLPVPPPAPTMVATPPPAIPMMPPG